MLQQIIYWINQVTFLGIEEGDSYLTKFRKRVMNRTSFLIAFAALTFILEGLIWGRKNVTIVPIFFIIIALSLLALNAQKRFNISFFVMSFILPSMFLGVIILYGATLKMDYTISFFIVLVLTLYDEVWIRNINIIYLILLQTFSLYYTSNYESAFSGYINVFDSLIVLTATTLGLFILVFQFIRESKKFQTNQGQLNDHLDKKNKELREIIVEKETLNQQLLEKTHDLQRANDFLESYTYITSHDLKTPVRNISSFSALLQKKLTPIDDPDVKDYLDFIRSGAIQIDGILNGIVENAQSNRSTLTLAHLDGQVLIEEIEQSIQIRLEEINGKIIYSGIPRVWADKMMLRKVFLNLIDNGLKYNNAKCPEVSIRYRRVNQQHEFTIADNGMGIPSQFSKDIFKMFKKLHGIGAFSGSGVGLALCRKIIELHGGHIWLESSSDATGSIFRFTLPIDPN